MGAASGPVIEHALYPIGNHSYTPSSAKWSNNGNRVRCETSANSRNWYFSTPSTRQSTSFQSSWPVWFSFNVGDEWEITVKNISFTNSSSGSNYCNIFLYSTGGSSAIGTHTVNFGSGTGTVADKTFTGIIGSAVDISAMRITIYRAVAPIEFDLELRVNGILYALN